MRRFAFDPFDGLLRLQEELERALERPSERWVGQRPARGIFPPVNVFSHRDGYVVRLELPGLSSEDISVETEGDTLTISGKREPGVVAASVHRLDRWSGEFSRSLQLPADLDLDGAKATCERGILTIEVPRREEAKPHRVEVKSS
jgi:HSP20 family protein